MKIQETSTVLNVNEIWSSLSKKDKSRVNKGSQVSIGQHTHEGWSGSLEHFIIRCPKCRALFLGYRHGFEGGQYFHCPNCQSNINC